ncbi:MAG: ATP-binding protein [Methanophagales archaeon]|nr:ATP-binding protein [Methanophagales archaeon]
MNEDIYRKRLKDLEDSIRQDLNLLKAFEDELRFETYPSRRAGYRRDIERQRESLNRHRQEYDKLKNGKIIETIEPPLIPLDQIPAVGIFIDREEDIKKIQSFFEEGVCRLVIIQGFPGIGKTLLAAKLSKLIHPPFKDVLWIKCHAEQSSPDVLFAKFHAFFEENEDHSLLGIWNDMKPELFDVKINRMIRALNAKCYLIIFDEFENWLGKDSQVKNDQVKKILSNLFCTAHKSKFILVSHMRPLFDPANDPLPLGSLRERTLTGLSELYAIQLLRESGLKINDPGLLSQIVKHCDGNPHMLRIFGYQVCNCHRDPKELIYAGPGETKFTRLLQDATSGLPEESRKALERLSIFCLSLSRDQLGKLEIPFDRAIGPLIDRFLVTDGDEGITLLTSVRKFVLDSLSEPQRLALHKQAASFYGKLRRNQSPKNYAELQLVLEEAYHKFQYGDNEGAAETILSVASLLVDWGYIEIAEQHVLRAEKAIRNERLLAQCAWILGSINDLRTNYTTALKHFDNALKLYRSVKVYEGVARTMFRIGRIHNALLEFKKADSYFQNCIDVCEKHEVNANRGASLLSMGWNRLVQSYKTEEVLDFYRQSLKYAEKEKDYKTLISAHRNIGFLLWIKRKQKDVTIKHYKDALQVSQNHNIVKEIGTIYAELGYLYDEWGDYNEAEENCHKAIEIFKALGNLYGIANAYCNLGKVLESKNVFDEAIKNYKQSIEVSSEIKNFGCTAYASLRLSMVYQKQNKLPEAEKKLQEAARLCQDHGLKEILKDVQIQLGKLKKCVR